MSDPQNFWQFLILVWNACEAKATRILGTTLGTLSVLAGTGLIPENQLKYYAGAIAILTYWRGQVISDTVNQAKVIVSNAASAAAATGTPAAIVSEQYDLSKSPQQNVDAVVAAGDKAIAPVVPSKPVTIARVDPLAQPSSEKSG